MSITFSPRGVEIDDENPEHDSLWVNLSNTNALDVLRWLGYEPDHYGSLDAVELAARCRRRMWDEKRNHDPAIPPVVEQIPNRAKLIVNGREEGYLRQQTERLLKLAEYAIFSGSKIIDFG